MSTKPDALSTPQIELAARIVAGEFGNPPRVRDIVSVAKDGHATTRKIMDYLLDNNRVIRNGKRYHLVQDVITEG